ncbi:hypothetical protein ACFE04_015976 [Oxalis oulophora]
MLLRTTKKILLKTLKGFKSFFSGFDNDEYHKLPKIPTTIDKQKYFYEEKLDSSSKKEKITKTLIFPNTTSDSVVVLEDNREERILAAAKKLKEVTMKAEMSDVDNMLDMEEVLHYYSRLTCPIYVDIVDKYLIDMYAEFVELPSRGALSVDSFRQPRVPSIRI